MTDHANELRRHARKIPHPQGETPGVMLRAADEIERLATKLKAAEKERDFAKAEIARLHDDIRELTDVRVLDEEDRDRIVAWLQGTSTKPAPSVPDTYAAGINAVAAMLQSKADEYAKEHGHDDMGGLSFGPGMGGEIKMDYYTNLIELADDVRAMIAAAPETKP